jgi:hypothetical protein
METELVVMFLEKINKRAAISGEQERDLPDEGCQGAKSLLA